VARYPLSFLQESGLTGRRQKGYDVVNERHEAPLQESQVVFALDLALAQEFFSQFRHKHQISGTKATGAA
jgi:hypothetical protein